MDALVMYLDGDQLDAEQTERAAALVIAVEILSHGVPRPNVKKLEFTYDAIDLASFILYGPDPGVGDPTP